MSRCPVGAEGPGVAAAAVEVPTGHAIAFRRGDVLVRVFGQPSDAVAVSRSVDATLRATSAPARRRLAPSATSAVIPGWRASTTRTAGRHRCDHPRQATWQPQPGRRRFRWTQHPSRSRCRGYRNGPPIQCGPDTVPPGRGRTDTARLPGAGTRKRPDQSPQPDPIGPGCGWAFTGAATPPWTRRRWPTGRRRCRPPPARRSYNGRRPGPRGGELLPTMGRVPEVRRLLHRLRHAGQRRCDCLAEHPQPA